MKTSCSVYLLEIQEKNKETLNIKMFCPMPVSIFMNLGVKWVQIKELISSFQLIILIYILSRYVEAECGSSTLYKLCITVQNSFITSSYFQFHITEESWDLLKKTTTMIQISMLWNWENTVNSNNKVLKF